MCTTTTGVLLGFCTLISVDAGTLNNAKNVETGFDLSHLVSLNYRFLASFFARALQFLMPVQSVLADREADAACQQDHVGQRPLYSAPTTDEGQTFSNCSCAFLESQGTPLTDLTFPFCSPDTPHPSFMFPLPLSGRLSKYVERHFILKSSQSPALNPSDIFVKIGSKPSCGKRWQGHALRQGALNQDALKKARRSQKGTNRRLKM